MSVAQLPWKFVRSRYTSTHTRTHAPPRGHTHALAVEGAECAALARRLQAQRKESENAQLIAKLGESGYAELQQREADKKQREADALKDARSVANLKATASLLLTVVGAYAAPVLPRACGRAQEAKTSAKKLFRLTDKDMAGLEQESAKAVKVGGRWMYYLPALVAAAEAKHSRQGLIAMAKESPPFGRLYASVLRQNMQDAAKEHGPAVVAAAIGEAEKAAAAERDAAAKRLEAAETAVRLCATLAAELAPAAPSTNSPSAAASAAPSATLPSSTPSTIPSAASSAMAGPFARALMQGRAGPADKLIEIVEDNDDHHEHEELPLGTIEAKQTIDPRPAKRPARTAAVAAGARLKRRRVVSEAESEDDESSAEHSDDIDDDAEDNDNDDSADDEDGDPNNDWCSACNGQGDLLCCDGCEHAYHGDCLDPKVDPESLAEDAPWFCDACETKRCPASGAS